MSDTSTTSIKPLPDGMEGLTHDWSSDQRAFKGVPWGKAMMWIFLLSCLLYTSPSPRDGIGSRMPSSA